MSGKIYRGTGSGYSSCVGHIDYDGNVYSDPNTEYSAECVGHIGNDNCIYRGKKSAWGENGQPIGHYDSSGNIYTGPASAWGEKGQPIAHCDSDGRIYSGAASAWGEKGRIIGHVEGGQTADCAAAMLLLLESDSTNHGDINYGGNQRTPDVPTDPKSFKRFCIFLIVLAVLGVAILFNLAGASLYPLAIIVIIMVGASCLGKYLQRKIKRKSTLNNRTKRSTTKQSKSFQSSSNIANGRKGGSYFHHADATHNYFCCPRCHATLRVPKNMGRIEITCTKCKNRFDVDD